MAEPSSPRLAVFDCDGTLVDSQGSIVAAMHAAFDALALPRPAPEAVRRIVGLPLAEAILRLVPEAAPETLAALKDGYGRAFSGMRAAGTLQEPLYPGVVDGLQALEDAGWLLGMATGKSQRGLRQTLERHDLYGRFVTLQTADLAAGKPHPDMLLRAMAETGAPPGSTVMIGDTTYDMEMARNAGTVAVGVAWGYHRFDELNAAGAHTVVHAFAELAATVNRLVGAD